MFSQKIVNNLSSSSWIRAMFEEGEKLRKLYGAEKVYDFTLGNPDPEPPKAVKAALRNLILDDKPGLHKYMNNAGFMDAREKLAAQIALETGVQLSGQYLIMTCGAAGGLNVVLKALLNPEEEVIVFAPYFVEYNFYIDNHGGKTVVSRTNTDTFEPDAESLKSLITPKTKAIIINSPNNPTGVVYSEEILKKIADVLEEKQKEYNSTIFVISDEPYTKLVYDGVAVPSVLKIFKNSIVVNSYSKSLALPGERIGYIAVNPGIKDVSVLMAAMVFCNRTLGYVNAPALFQRVVAEAANETVDTSVYEERRNALYDSLIKLGFKCTKPQGAFYLFPKSPVEDDVEFVKAAVKHNLLLVPGKGFGCPGYFRIAYCVSMETIKNSIPAFEALAKEFIG